MGSLFMVVFLPLLQFQIRAAGLLLQHDLDDLGDVRAGLGGDGAGAVDVG